MALFYVPIFDLTSLLPDMETLTGLQRPHTTNPRQRKPYFNLPIPDFQNTSILFFKYHTVYTLCFHSLPSQNDSLNTPHLSLFWPLLLRKRPVNRHALVSPKVQRNTLPHKENISLL